MPSTLSPVTPTTLPDGSSLPESIVVLPESIVVIELRTGLWMVKEQPKDTAIGVIRGYLTEDRADNGVRYLARLPHANPTEGPRLGEYGEWALAVQRVLSSSASPVG